LGRRVSPEGPQRSGGRACALTRVDARGIQNLKLVLDVIFSARPQPSPSAGSWRGRSARETTGLRGRVGGWRGGR
jgi:hypothetical protein